MGHLHRKERHSVLLDGGTCRRQRQQILAARSASAGSEAMNAMPSSARPRSN
jgi:hypothetical protein